MTRPNGWLRVTHGTMATTFSAHYAEDLNVIRIFSDGWWTCPYHRLPELIFQGRLMSPICKMEFRSALGKGSRVLFEHNQPITLQELIRRLSPINIPKHFVRPPNESATPTRGQ